MEAADVAAALDQTVNVPGFIMVKGICAPADGDKNDLWQEYAANAAAALVLSFLRCTHGHKCFNVTQQLTYGFASILVRCPSDFRY